MTKGRCVLCGGVFSKRKMARHLASCRTDGSGTAKRKVFLLKVEGRYSSKYWMYLEAASDARLEDLDRFLRNVWLECCGHLSAFEIDGETYISYPEGEENGLDVLLGSLLYQGQEFYHQYDFGTTTDLVLEVVSDGERDAERRSVRLLARNEPPLILCQTCGKEAVWVCAQCIYEGGGWLCQECASNHECGEEMLLPVVNSPRVGMCAYGV